MTDSIDKNATQYSSLIGKVVFITGGATGIGAAMVKAFVGQKATVAFIDIDEQVSARLITGIESENHDAQICYRKVDVTDPETLQLAILEASKALGNLHVLVNNVGNDARQEVENISAYDWHKCMQVNLDPAFFASQAAFKIMREHASGSIINFSSINALIGPQQMTGYVTAKTGLMGMTKSPSRDFGVDNIRVNAILPGWVATDRQLAKSCVNFQCNGYNINVIPGLSCKLENNNYDCMRGEELQILGWLQLAEENQVSRHVVCLPGTHTKWLLVEDGKIKLFKTALTGGLFSVRSRQLFGQLSAQEATSYLSGLLIGSDVHASMNATE